MQLHEEAREVPISHQADVVVVGGGTAGPVAALAAARTGARTVLIERYGFLGGCCIGGATGLHSFYNIFKQEPGYSPKKIVEGIPQELVDRLTEAGGGLGHVEMERGGDFVSMLTPVDPEAFKHVVLQMLSEAGVSLLLHSLAVGAPREGQEIKAVVVESKSGREAVAGKVFVDCTGDGDVAALAGAPFRHFAGEGNYGVSMTFRMANIALERARDFLDERGAITQLAHAVKHGAAEPGVVRLGMSLRPWEEERKPRGLHGRILATSTRANDLTHLNCTGYAPLDGISRDDLCKAEVELRRQVTEMAAFLKQHVGGFEGSYLVNSAVGAGVRRTRIIECLYDLTRDDVLEGRGFDSEIGRFAFIDNGQYFVRDGGSYGIPYEALVAQGVDNLLVAGRMISSDRVVHNSTRNTACCMAQGQGAGTAAAMCALEGDSPAELDVQRLRRKLKDDGAYFESA
ncbi:MAG: FAD-dependent oxidoreductase [Armatimonadota bacterium]